MSKQVSIESQIVRSTVRLSAGREPSKWISTGTGFYYQVRDPDTKKAKCLIITNKHVINGCEFVQFVLSFEENKDDGDAADSDLPIELPLAGRLTLHPDPKIDLCAIDVTSVYSRQLSLGKRVRLTLIDCDWLPSSTDEETLTDIEQVLVIGYPRGLWDEHNNMPIARRGITGTHPLKNYAGNPDFLIDVAAFSGSSGSPVFSYETPMFRQPNGSFTPGTKIALIGIVWGVIEQTVTGEMRVEQSPSSIPSVPSLKASLNLAIALHSNEIRKIEAIVLASLLAETETSRTPTS
jgi:Trypsin-like peptidase domain